MTQLTIVEMRGFAKKLNISTKGKSADDLKEEILNGIEESLAKVKKTKKLEKIEEWKKDNSDLVEFYQKFEDSDKTPPAETKEKLKEIKKEVEKKKTEVKTKKEEKAAKKKEKKAKKTPEDLSVFGHRKNSMGGAIDEMVAKGTTMKAMIQALKKEFKKDEGAIERKINAHLKSLESGKVVITRKGDNIKGKE